MWSYVLPSKGQAVLTTVTTVVCSACEWLFGEWTVSLAWLLVFAVTDYVIGTIVAFKTGQWSSSIGFKGILKKVLMFFIVALCHGLDQATGFPFIMSAVVIAYCVNEVGSILESLERGGCGSVIPTPLRKGLALLRKKSEQVSLEGVDGSDIEEKKVDKEDSNAEDKV